jgi:predicted acylesterase/phospholipase RssA
MPAHSANEPNEAVAFTAGPSGAFFAAGTIHAWLAADRTKPAVAAGISMGALSAAAMQAALLEIERFGYGCPLRRSRKTRQAEAARWDWFRKYVATLTSEPENVIWDAIPNTSDFFADANVAPVRDPSIGAGLSDELRDELRAQELEANRRRFLITNLGQWFGALPVTVSRIATTIVRYVRWKENYPFLNKAGRLLAFIDSLSAVVLLAVWHIVKSPRMFKEGMFDGTASMKRPLFGWRIYLLAIGFLAVALGLFAANAAGLICVAAGVWLFIAGDPSYWLFSGLAPTLLMVAAGALWRRRKKQKRELVEYRSLSRSFILNPLLTSLGFDRSLLSNFHLRVRLLDLFQDRKVGKDPFPVLLVAAPLQTLYNRATGQPLDPQQIWASTEAGGQALSVPDALLAAMAAPGLWPPTQVSESDVAIQWQGVDPKTVVPNGSSHPYPMRGSIDVVDGAIVRKNPLPALLGFLSSPAGRAVRGQLEGGVTAANREKRVHVIYSTPLGDLVVGRDCLRQGPIQDDADANIVRVALLSRELANRRDTEMEIKQLNFVTDLALQTGNPSNVVLALADEIAPENSMRDQARQDNSSLLEPPRRQLLRRVAEGCRRTLGVLHRDRLPIGGVRCREFLVQIAPARPWQIIETPGLPEVCEACSQVIEPVPERQEPSPSRLLGQFPNLHAFDENGGRLRPRVVFVASGGVFRGSFHIGMIGALRKLELKPDLVAGASVGTLMGGTMAALFSVDNTHAKAMLNNFVDVFEHVDVRIALTKTLKNAARELGIRGRAIHLSPNMVRKMLHRGPRADAAFATTGSPPALIDAISKFLAIPVNRTQAVARDFVAGLVAQATSQLLKEMQQFTLKSLNIEEAVLGASLLENEARSLLSKDELGNPIADIQLDSSQPFQKEKEKEKGIAFVASSTNLGAQAMALLWDNIANASDFRYDFIKAALASSAFPAVFRPVRASEVFPGEGRFDVRYSDGGLFDNLPFIPSIAVLRDAQVQESADKSWDARQQLDKLLQTPDLFLAGALDANPKTDPHKDGPFDFFSDVSQRGTNVGKNGKIRSYLAEVAIIERLLQKIPKSARIHPSEFIRGVVNPAILAVFPADKKHLNPSFAFSGATGFDPKKVLRSIADGCFQTWSQFAGHANGLSYLPTTAAGRALNARNVRVVSRRPPGAPLDGTCPFFELGGAPFDCPFAKLNGLSKREQRLYKICAKDEAHEPNR